MLVSLANAKSRIRAMPAIALAAMLDNTIVFFNFGPIADPDMVI
jgi:hypothetical protein